MKYTILIFSILLISCSDSYDEPLTGSSEKRSDIIEDIEEAINFDDETQEQIETVQEDIVNGEEVNREIVEEIINTTDNSQEAIDEMIDNVENSDKLTEEEKTEAIEVLEDIALDETQTGLEEMSDIIANDDGEEAVTEDCKVADNNGLLPPMLPINCN